MQQMKKKYFCDPTYLWLATKHDCDCSPDILLYTVELVALFSTNIEKILIISERLS